VSELEAKTISAAFPLGTVIPYAGKADQISRKILAESGWLVCDGAAISRSIYRSLYSVIGDIHGRGDATTTFNLPDYRGHFLRGVDDSSGRDPDARQRVAAKIGGLAGDVVGSIQQDSFKAHTHDVVQMIGDNNIDGVDSTTKRSGEHHNETRQSSVSGGNETRPINVNVHWLLLAGAAQLT
jgi:microcystin-dependent protein